MSKIINYTKCPLCENSDFKQILKTKDYTVSQETYKIIECNNCSFKFTQDIPNQTEIGKYYASENYISHSNTQKGVINKLYHFARNYMLNAKANLLEKQNKTANKNLLDIGCGTGYFLNTMQAKNWQVTGIEADEGARKFAEQNFNIIPQDIDKLFGLPSNNYQAITMWHVLEHVHTLHEYIAQIHHLLADDGTLIIAVPNANCLDAKHYKEYWAGWDVPRHLYHFTPQTMNILLEKHNFKIVQKKLMPFDPFYIAMLSEKYQNSKLAFIKAIAIGKLSLFNSFLNTNKASSVIYIAKKK